MGWYLDSPFEAFLTEQGIPADHSSIWRWVQCYAPELNKRCRWERKPTNGSWRVDETYVRVKGKWVYLYRAVDSTGATIDFLLSAHRDAAAAKRFFQRALRAPGHPRPRVIKVDGNPSYPRVEPGWNRTTGRSKRRVNASQGLGSFHGTLRTIQGYEAVHMIRKGQVRWLPKGDVVGLVLFIHETLGLRGGIIHAHR